METADTRVIPKPFFSFRGSEVEEIKSYYKHKIFVVIILCNMNFEALVF